MSTPTIKIYPNNKKRESKTGKIPIYCRITHGVKKKEFRLPKLFDILPNELGSWNFELQRLNKKNCETNDYLNKLQLTYSSYLIYGDGAKKEVTLSGLIALLRNSNIVEYSENKDVTALEYVSLYLQEEIETPVRKEGTKRNYRNAIRQLKQYLFFSKKEKMLLKNFSFTEAQGFKLYLEKELLLREMGGMLVKKKANKIVSSSTKIKNIRPIFAKAVAEGILKDNPFSKVKLDHRSPKSPNLNPAQVKAFFDLDLSQKPELTLVKDLFLFMCFTGLSITDVLSLNTAEIKQTSSGRILLDTTRDKTKKSIRQIIVRPAEMIMKRYTTINRSMLGERIFPSITDVDINRKLKILAVMANIEFTLSTKIARITCRELLYEAQISEPLIVDCFMGWSSAGNIRNQYYGITENKLLDFSCKFEIYLHKVIIENKVEHSEYIKMANSLLWN